MEWRSSLAVTALATCVIDAACFIEATKTLHKAFGGNAPQEGFRPEPVFDQSVVCLAYALSCAMIEMLDSDSDDMKTHSDWRQWNTALSDWRCDLERTALEAKSGANEDTSYDNWWNRIARVLLAVADANAAGGYGDLLLTNAKRALHEFHATVAALPYPVQGNPWGLIKRYRTELHSRYLMV